MLKFIGISINAVGAVMGVSMSNYCEATALIKWNEYMSIPVAAAREVQRSLETLIKERNINYIKCTEQVTDSFAVMRYSFDSKYNYEFSIIVPYDCGVIQSYAELGLYDIRRVDNVYELLAVMLDIAKNEVKYVSKR